MHVQNKTTTKKKTELSNIPALKWFVLNIKM